MEDAIAHFLTYPIRHLYALLWRLDLLEVDVDETEALR